MARIRTVKPEFWRHPVLGRLPDDQQLLALALLSMADDEGFFRAQPELIRGDVQPFRDDLATISRGLAKLSEIGWIELVDHPEQGSIGRVKKWDDHQKVDHPRGSKLRKYFTCEHVANSSRSSRDNFALEQGSGNRDQGRGNGNSASPAPAAQESVRSQSDTAPPDLNPLQFASRLLQEIGLPETRDNNTIVAAAITALSREKNTVPAAYDFLLSRAKDAQDEGVEINRFWFEDSRWKTNGGTNRNARPTDAHFLSAEPALAPCSLGQCDGSGVWIEHGTRRVRECGCTQQRKTPAANPKSGPAAVAAS
jgi:hypothetical protein